MPSVAEENASWKKGLTLNWYISINQLHDAKHECLVSMQISMNVLFSW